MQAHERMAELERESLAKLAELETELGALKVEYADALEARRLVEEELTALKRQRQDSARRQSVLENKIIELETLTGTLTKGSSGTALDESEMFSACCAIINRDANKCFVVLLAASLRNGTATSPLSNSDNVTSDTFASTPSPTDQAPPPAPAPPPPPPPPCPPPPPMAPLSPGDHKLPPPVPIPPPPAGMMQAPDGAMTIKRKVRISRVAILAHLIVSLVNCYHCSISCNRIVSLEMRSGPNKVQTSYPQLDRSETQSSAGYHLQ